MVVNHRYSYRYGMGHFSPSEKNWHLPQHCHLSWLEKSDVRHISQGAPHLHLDLLSGHVLIFTVWFGVQLRPTAAQSSHGFKALHCLLNHNTNCPCSGLNKRFFFLFSVSEVPPVRMICLWGSLHLIKWASLSLWGLPIKRESKGNSMPPADSDWW